MKRINLLCKRLLLACAVSMFAASVCGAQTPPDHKAAPDKERAADKSSALDEELSKTPAGRTVAKFFAAFNSGDLKTMRAFHESFGGDPENAEKDLEVYEQTGGLKPHSLTSAAKDKIAVLVQTKKDARWLAFQFTLNTQEPYNINDLNLRPASPPAN
ncbi:MAG TPA: hypothetical protein VEZ40_02765 [Pyrinomonadaceae bacterium]|nr:hypothetical protein [Pyrinomonadaceae bacterium]